MQSALQILERKEWRSARVAHDDHLSKAELGALSTRLAALDADALHDIGPVFSSFANGAGRAIRSIPPAGTNPDPKAAYTALRPYLSKTYSTATDAVATPRAAGGLFEKLFDKKAKKSALVARALEKSERLRAKFEAIAGAKLSLEHAKSGQVALSEPRARAEAPRPIDAGFQAVKAAVNALAGDSDGDQIPDVAMGVFMIDTDRREQMYDLIRHLFDKHDQAARTAINNLRS